MLAFLTPDQLTRLDAVLARGLRSGSGQDLNDLVCAEQALALACDEGLTDAPSCAAAPDRAFTLGINDAAWSSPAARAAGMRPLILAQIGTAGTDRLPWVRALVAGTIRRVVPVALRAAAAVHPIAEHRAASTSAAIRCEHDGDLAAACAAAKMAAHVAAESTAERATWTAEAAERAAAWAADAARAADAADAERASASAAATAWATDAAWAADAERAASRAAAAARSAVTAPRAAELVCTSAVLAGAAADEVLLIAVQVALDAYEATASRRARRV